MDKQLQNIYLLQMQLEDDGNLNTTLSQKSNRETDDSIYHDRQDSPKKLKLPGRNRGMSKSHSVSSGLHKQPALSTESELARLNVDFKDQNTSLKAKQILQRFFRKHSKAEENLKLLQDVMKYEAEEKREVDRKKSQIAEMSRQSYLKQITDKQLQRARQKEERLINS
jgi:hypothetical protein